MKLNIGGQMTADRFPSGWECVDRMPGSQHVCDISRQTLPFEDDTADAVYFSHILEHIFEERHSFVLSEIKRVLKPGASLRVVVPNMDIAINAIYNARQSGNPSVMRAYMSWWFSYKVHPKTGDISLDHVTGFDCDSLYKLLSESGFANIQRKKFGDFSMVFEGCDNPIHAPTSLYFEMIKGKLKD